MRSSLCGVLFVCGMGVVACSASSASGTKGGASDGASGGTNKSGGASAGASGSYALVTPLVRAAAPASLGGTVTTTMATRDFHVADLPVDGGGAPGPGGPPGGSLSAADIKSRFFEAGPTNIYGILGAIDSRIVELNTRAATQRPACLDQEPVAYPITPLGASVTFYAQCYEQMPSPHAEDPGLIQFGQKDGVTYYYAAQGAAWVAATLTPKDTASQTDAGASDDAGSQDDGGSQSDAGEAAPRYVVHAWSGVGYLNAVGCGDKSGYDDCSYGFIELQADTSEHTFEMSVAGIGFGYCGAQLKSDGDHVYAAGSIDMASSCVASGAVCVSPTDLTTEMSCEGSATTFALAPLGRVSTPGPHAGGPGVDAGPNPMWAPSEYPGGAQNGVTLDGTSSDSLHFGPTAPTPGAGKL